MCARVPVAVSPELRLSGFPANLAITGNLEKEVYLFPSGKNQGIGEKCFKSGENMEFEEKNQIREFDWPKRESDQSVIDCYRQ